MIKIAIALSVILLLVILYLLFKIQILASVFRGSYRKDIGKSNKVNGVLFLLFLIFGGIAFIWSFTDASEEMILPIASVHGVDVDQMFWVTMIVIGIVFALTQVLLFVYSYKYQHKEGRRAFFLPHNNKVEIIWTVIPAIVMALLVFNGWKTWSKITSPAPEEAVVIEVMGKQFNWMVRYPGQDNKLGVVKHTLINANNEFGIDFTDKNSMDDILPQEFHIPKGKPVLLKIRSRDVIHSVFLPHFRVKMDAVPGMPTKFWFVPTKTTAEMATETGNSDFKFELACTEVCGRGHFAMRMLVVVDEPEDYEKWLAKQKAFVVEHPEVLEKGGKSAAGGVALTTNKTTAAATE